MKLFKTLSIMLLAGSILSACGQPAEEEGAASTDNGGYTGETLNDGEEVAAAPQEPREPFTPGDATVTPLATYGPITIYAEEFLYFLNLNASGQTNFLIQLGMPQEVIDEHWSSEAIDGLTNRELVHQETWQEVLDRATLRYIAVSRGYTFTPEMEISALEDIEEFINMTLAGGEDPYEFFYELAGITLETFSLIQPDMMIVNDFLISFSQSYETDEAFALSFFEEHREALEAELGMLVSTVHILVDTMEEAQALLARLNAGERARDLAPIYSTDPGRVQDEGAYHFPRGQMVPEFENWSFDANIGDTGIVESTHGFHVMYLEGRETLNDRDHMSNLMQIAAEVAALEYIENLVDQTNLDFEIDYQLLSSIDF